MKKLDTELSNYSQNVTNLGESVLFDEISLKSLNGKLSVQARRTMFDVFLVF